MRLQAVVPAAQAAEVVAVGRTPFGVRDDMVEIGPAGLVPAAGVTACPVAGRHPTALCRGGYVPRALRRPCHHRTSAVVPEVFGTPAAYSLLQLSTRERCEQRAPGAEQIYVQRTTGGRLEAAGTDGVHSGEQGPEVLHGDGLPLDLGDTRRPATDVGCGRIGQQRVERRDDPELGGDRWARVVPRTERQVCHDLGPDLPDRTLVAFGFGLARVVVHHDVDGCGHRLGEDGDHLGHAVERLPLADERSYR